MSRKDRKEVVGLSLSTKAIRHVNRLVTGVDVTYRGRSRSNIVDQIILQHEIDCREKGEVNAKS